MIDTHSSDTWHQLSTAAGSDHRDGQWQNFWGRHIPGTPRRKRSICRLPFFVFRNRGWGRWTWWWRYYMPLFFSAYTISDRPFRSIRLCKSSLSMFFCFAVIIIMLLRMALRNHELHARNNERRVIIAKHIVADVTVQGWPSYVILTSVIQSVSRITPERTMTKRG